MPISIQCEQCSSRFTVPESVGGKVGKCPKCGNRIAIPSLESTPVIVVPPSHATASHETSRGSNPLVGIVVGIVACVLLVMGLLALTSNPRNPPVVDQPAMPLPVESLAVTGTEPEDVSTALAEVDSPPGLGVSLSQFKRDMPSGDAWEVVTESTNEDGRVSYQLLSTKMENLLLIVAGSPDDLREVSLTFAIKTDMNDAEVLTRVALMLHYAAKYSNWTEEEIGQFWHRLLKVGAGDESQFKIQKGGHTFWMTPLGVTDGTMFMTGVGVEPDSDAPTLQQWLDAHPAPEGPDLYKYSDKVGKVTNNQFAFKGLRRKNDGTFIGEMTNNTNQEFQLVSFKMSIYDQNGELHDTAAIVFTGFGPGQTRSFEAYVESVPAEYLYKIDFENGL